MSRSGEDVPPLPIPILQLVHEAQSIHGLKHFEYTRYRYVHVAKNMGDLHVYCVPSLIPFLAGNIARGDFAEYIKAPSFFMEKADSSRKN